MHKHEEITKKKNQFPFVSSYILINYFTLRILFLYNSIVTILFLKGYISM